MRKTRKSRTILHKNTYKSGRKQRGGNPYGGGPLHTAIFNGDSNEALKLIDQGVNLNEKNNKGMTPMMMAAMFGFSAVVNYLILKGANMNEKDKDGKTVFMLVIGLGNQTMVKLLLNAGAKLNEVDDLGYTPLMIAAITGNYSMMETLLNAGADVNAQNKNRTVLSYIKAKLAETIKIINLLFDHNITPSELDKPFLFEVRRMVKTLMKRYGNQYNSKFPRLSDRVFAIEKHSNLTNTNINAYVVNTNTNEWIIGPGNGKNNHIPRNLLPGTVPVVPMAEELHPAEVRPAQPCELRHTSEYPVRQGERNTVNVKQSQGWQGRQTMLSGDYVATRMSGPAVEAAVEVNPRKTCAGPGCTIMGGKRKYRI